MRMRHLNEIPELHDGDNWDFRAFENEPQKIKYEIIQGSQFFIKPFKGEYYYFMWDGHSTWYLILTKNDEYTIIGYLKLLKYTKLKNAMQVDGVDIHKKYRGQGLSTFMYRSVKNKTGVTIVSDYIQYKNYRQIWTSLASKDTVKIFDEDTKTLSNKIKIENSDDSDIWGKNHAKNYWFLSQKPSMIYLVDN